MSKNIQKIFKNSKNKTIQIIRKTQKIKNHVFFRSPNNDS